MLSFGVTCKLESILVNNLFEIFKHLPSSLSQTLLA